MTHLAPIALLLTGTGFQAALDLHQQGRYQEAYPILVNALHQSSEQSAEQITILAALTVNHQARGDNEQARNTYRHAATIGAPATAQTLSNLGAAAQAAGLLEDAGHHYREALALAIDEWGAGDLRTAAIQEKLGRLYQVRGQPHEAESLIARALATRVKALGKDHPSLAAPLARLAEIHVITNHWVEAEREARKAVAIASTAPLRASANTVLGNVLRLSRRYEEAEAPYRAALDILEEMYGPDDPQVAVALTNLAGLYRAQKRHTEAEALILRAEAIRPS